MKRTNNAFPSSFFSKDNNNFELQSGLENKPFYPEALRDELSRLYEKAKKDLPCTLAEIKALAKDNQQSAAHYCLGVIYALGSIDKTGAYQPPCHAVALIYLSKAVSQGHKEAAMALELVRRMPTPIWIKAEDNLTTAQPAPFRLS